MKPTEKLKQDQIDNINKAILQQLSFLHPYVKHRLHVAEKQNKIAKNQFISGDIVDEVVLKALENKERLNEKTLKVDLFKMADFELDKTIAKEEEKNTAVSSEEILEEELKGLEIEFYGHYEGDIVLKEDLEDIEHHQFSENDNTFQEEAQIHLVQELDLHTETLHNEQEIADKFYDWCPGTIANIIDLRVFGKLSPTEIAKVKNLEPQQVQHILQSVPQNFKHQH